MINYAHRGASAYAPENTLASFYLGLQMNANGIETDIQRTKDGHLVLFHDDSLLRIFGKEGAIADYAYAQLLQMDFGAHKGYIEERIVLFSDFLKYFAPKPIHLALEIKQAGIEKQVFEEMEQATFGQTPIVTSFSLSSLTVLRRLTDDVSLGWLTHAFDQAVLDTCKAEKIGQVCPPASLLTVQNVADAHAQGFSVRAWGVKDVTLMRHACLCGVDGMTVNFPDKLQAELSKA